MATFLDGVNRLLRIATIIRGDDDAITTFSDTQHSADIQLAQIAIQSEITEVVSDQLLPYEKTSGTITLTTSTRTYALASDFIRFYGAYPSFYDSTDKRRIYAYKGGDDRLRDIDYDYKTTTGTPSYWYWENTTTKQVAFYNVPDSNYNNRSLTYDYEKSVMVSNATDTLPFHNNEEYYAFIDMAHRRFEFIRNKQPQGDLLRDATYTNAKARLANLLRPTNPKQSYGKVYR